MQTQYSQGAATSHHPSYAASEIPGNGGSITSSLRQWRKKDYVEKQQSGDTSTSVAENTSHVARVAPHTYYPPRPANDVCHYQHQYSEYGDPYKPPAVAPVKYSEIVENQLPSAIDNIPPILPKHKEKEYVEFPLPQPPHLKQYQDLPLKPPYPDSLKQSYSDQYMVKESQMPPYMQKQSQMHQYMPKEPYQQFLSKYNMQNQYPPQPYPSSEPNNFLAHLNKINPRMAQSIMNDTHLREAQMPMYHNIDQSRTYPHSQRMYHGPSMNTSPTHPHRNIPSQPYNYPQPYNCSVKQSNDPYNRIQYQHNVPKYLPDYKMNSPVEPNIPNISPQGLYNERLHMNYGPMSPKMSPNYPCSQLEYAQHYQHRRAQMPPEYFQSSGYKPPYMDNSPMLPDENCTNQRVRKPSLKQYLENWVDEELAGNLPDIIISNNMNEQTADSSIKSSVCAKSGSDKQEQPLYVLDSTEIPDENLPHFLHLQQFEKLPDNIRGYYHSANAVSIGNRRMIVESDPASGTNQAIRNDSKIRTEIPASVIGNKGCAISNLSKIGTNTVVSGILPNSMQNVENNVVQIHIIEEPDITNGSTNIVDACNATTSSESVTVKPKEYQPNLIINKNENCFVKQQDQALHALDNSHIIKDNLKNMPVIDDEFNIDETSDCINSGSLSQSEDSSSNQSNNDESLHDVFTNQQVCGEDLTTGISSIYKEMESMQTEVTTALSHNKIAESNNSKTDLNEKIIACIPEQGDTASIKFDNEINEYLHSASENIEFAQSSVTLQETAAATLALESFALSNSNDNDIADLQKDAVSLIENIVTDTEVLSQTPIVSPEKDEVPHISENVSNIVKLDSVIEDIVLNAIVTNINPENKMEQEVVDETSDTKESKIEENTKETVNEKCTLSDQSSDDDTSMPDIDKYVEQAPEFNNPELLQNKNEMISTVAECDDLTKENCHEEKNFQEKLDDFEKPPDLTDSKFGLESEEIKEHTETQLAKDQSLLETLKESNLQVAKEKSESCKILEKVTVIENSISRTNADKTAEAKYKPKTDITKDKLHKKHKYKSDKSSKKYKEKERSSSKTDKHESKASRRTEKISSKIEKRPNREHREAKHDKEKSVKKYKEYKTETKKGNLKIKSSELLQISETSIKSSALQELPSASVLKEISLDIKNFAKPTVDLVDQVVPKSEVTSDDLEKLPMEMNAFSPIVDNSEASEQPLTMIKVEQTYLEETENANTNVIYQIADNNVVLQIADELLEINVTTHNGRKVIFVKTLTDALILSNCDESDLDIPPEELRYERICEDVEILLNNNYLTETRLSNSYNINNDEDISQTLKELCETDGSVLVGDDVCISNEEIVSSSTAEMENERKQEQNVERKLKSKKVTCEDDKQQSSTLQDGSQSISNETQEQPTAPLNRPKTKAALKYVEATTDNLALTKQDAPSISNKVPDKPKKLKTKKPKLQFEKVEEVKDNYQEGEKSKNKATDTRNKQNTDECIKAIEKSTKSKKRKASSPLKCTLNRRTSLSFPIKIEKDKIETHVLKTKIIKNSDSMELSGIIEKDNSENIICNNDIARLHEETVDPTDKVETPDELETVIAEINDKCIEVDKAMDPDVKESEETQVSVQENSITSSTSLQESETLVKPTECKLAQQISEEWEDDADEIKAPPPPPPPPVSSIKKRLSLEEYNNRKRSNSIIEQVSFQQSDLTNNLLDNISYTCLKNKRALSPSSPVLSVNFNNKTYSRNFSLSSKSSLSPSTHYGSLTNSIELQLPKINRTTIKPVYSEEYLQNALRNDLHTVNAFTTSLIKENQQLMQRFLNQQRLTLDELKKVKQIIRYKRLIQQLTTLKINGLTSSPNYDSYGIMPNIYKPNTYDLDKHQSIANNVTMEDPLKSFHYETERRRRKRFRFLYGDKERAINFSSELPHNIFTESRDCCFVKRPRLDEAMESPELGEGSVGYSVRPSNSESQLTLVFKRSFKNDPKMQPYVKLERLFSIDQLAKNRFY